MNLFFWYNLNMENLINCNLKNTSSRNENYTNIANINPIRYRSYYYDKETNLYYLNTRYYDPDTMRFISLDDISYLDYETLGGLNLFTYCNNNPIMYVDPDGKFFFSLTALIVGAIVGATIGATVSVISQGIANGWSNINGWQVLVDGTIGLLSGLLAASGFGTLASAFISSVLGFTGSVVGDIIESNGEWKSIDWSKAAILGVVNFGLGLLSGAGSQNSKALSKALLKNKEVNKTFSILYNASNKYIVGNMSNRGIAGVFNLYGKHLLESISKVIPNLIARLTFNNLVKVGLTNIITVLISPFVDKLL